MIHTLLILSLACSIQNELHALEDSGQPALSDVTEVGGAPDSEDTAGAEQTGEDGAGLLVEEPETGRTYLLHNEHMDWAQARDWCLSQDMVLATVNDDAENTLIHALIWGTSGEAGLLNHPTWIGYHSDGGDWRWESGETPGFTAFSGEVITDEWGTASMGQSAAFADIDAPVWQEAPGSWSYTVICEG